MGRRGQQVVVRYDDSVLKSWSAKIRKKVEGSFLEDVAFVRHVGIRVIIVDSVRNIIQGAWGTECSLPIDMVGPIGFDDDDEIRATNADFVAAVIAGAFAANKFIIMTDTEGFPDKQGGIISSMDSTVAKQLIEQEKTSRRKVVQLDACLRALKGGVRRAYIIDGRQDHVLMALLFSNQKIGTEVRCAKKSIEDMLGT